MALTKAKPGANLRLARLFIDRKVDKRDMQLKEAHREAQYPKTIHRYAE